LLRKIKCMMVPTQQVVECLSVADISNFPDLKHEYRHLARYELRTGCPQMT